MKLGNYDQEPINYEGIASENIDAYENFVGRVSHMINRMPDTPLKFLLYHMALDQNLREEYFNDWVRAGREVGSINPFGFIIRSFQVLFPHKDERGEVIEDGKDRILAIDELYKRQNPGLAISPFKTGIYGIQNIVVDGGLMHRTRCWVLYFKAVDADGVSRKKPEYILWTEDSDKDLYYSAHQYIKPYNSSHVEGEINRAINRGE